MIIKCCSLIARDQKQYVAAVNKIINVYPSTVFISQRQGIPDDTICSADNLPVNCKRPQPCACSHVEKIALNSAVEIVLVDESALPIFSDIELWFNEQLLIGFQLLIEFNFNLIQINFYKIRRIQIQEHFECFFLFIINLNWNL